SVPLASTSRFRRMAAYTRCLRCAGAHRRPASGSGLSLLIPSWHAALSDLGEFDHRFGPEHRCRHWPSLWTKGLGTPNNPAIRFARGTVFAATLVRYCYGLSGCWPPCTDLTSLPANGGFYFQAFDGSVTLPVAGYNYNSVWTPLLTGLSPAGMAASLAALVRPCVARELSSSWRMCGLASMYPAFGWSLLCSGPSWVSARVRSHYRKGLKGPFGSPVFACTGKTDPPSRF